MDLLPLLVTAGGCLLFSLAVFFLRERLQQTTRTPIRSSGNDLPFDRTA